MIADISSPQNRWVKFARSLHRRRVRDKERVMLVEGPRAITEAVKAGAQIHVAFVSSEIANDSPVSSLFERVIGTGSQGFRVAPVVLNQICDTENPQGIVAIIPIPDLPLAIPTSEHALLLVADEVRDPGNLGTMIRSAHGAGAHAVLVAPQSADPFSPKVVRAAMGSHFHLPVRRLEWDHPPDALESSEIYAASASATETYDEVDWCAPSALVVGNETHGLSSAAIARTDKLVGIPIASTLESLNAGIAASVVLFEAARQRRAREV